MTDEKDKQSQEPEDEQKNDSTPDSQSPKDSEINSSEHKSTKPDTPENDPSETEEQDDKAKSDEPMPGNPDFEDWEEYDDTFNPDEEEYYTDKYPYDESDSEDADQDAGDTDSAGAAGGGGDDGGEPPDDDDGEDDEDEEPEDEKGKGKKRKKKKKDSAEKAMPFLEHLEELRWTLMRSLLAIIVAAVAAFFFSEQIMFLLRQPAPPDLKLIFLSPTEGFVMYLKVSLFAGLVIALPYVAWELWRFIVPGLLSKERKLVPGIVFFTVLCFAAGAAFAYFVILKFGLKFLLSFANPDLMVANLTIGKYLGFVVTIILVFGLVFELPVMSFFLSAIGILTPDFLKKYRRYGIVIIFIMAALLTPPDIVTQLMLAGPLILLYEISVWVSAAVARRRKEKEELEDD